MFTFLKFGMLYTIVCVKHTTKLMIATKFKFTFRKASALVLCIYYLVETVTKF